MSHSLIRQAEASSTGRETFERIEPIIIASRVVASSAIGRMMVLKNAYGLKIALLRAIYK